MNPYTKLTWQWPHFPLKSDKRGGKGLTMRTTMIDRTYPRPISANVFPNHSNRYHRNDDRKRVMVAQAA